MKILRTITELRKELAAHQNKKIGFVPTMGYFHEGHLSLMNHASSGNDIAVASIFVNPLQFGPNEDFETYPRDEERDAELARNAGIDYLFIPTVETMYPNKMRVSLHMTSRTDVLCGASRPGHFDGVITVLAKLFNIVMPDRVYMGLKDAQQFSVVEAFCKDLNFSHELIGVPTVREDDGLAKSSRNIYLSESERAQAPSLYKALQMGKKIAEDGEESCENIMKHVMKQITDETSGIIDYVRMLSFPELEEVVDKPKGKMILAAAVNFSRARLIDNVIFEV